MNLRISSIFILLAYLAVSCSSEPKTVVDQIISATAIYTSDSTFSKAECMAITDGRIVATSSKREINRRYTSENKREVEGYIYPGFIDAHSHFYGYGKALISVDLRYTSSLEDIVQTTVDYAKNHTDLWIYGRGWDETDWVEQGTVNNTKLSLLFPDRPVILRRIDGHAALANNKALEMAGIDVNTVIEGGQIEKINGRLTGLLVDKAADRVLDLIPEPSRPNQIRALLLAQKNCLEAGLTTVTDAGLDLDIIHLIDSLQESGDLKIRVYAMANPSTENFEHWLKEGPIHKDRLEMSSFKLYADGALGSWGAMLKEEYCDRHGHLGTFVNPPHVLDSFCNILYQSNFQVNTHCIGDSANRKMLEIYSKYLGGINDRRWRIEHAQVVSPDDRVLFKDNSIIPSVQPTHATSDMYWAENRLCKERMDGAYAYQSLLQIHGFIPLGTDFPIESIKPLFTFQSAVYRKNEHGKPLHGFLADEALSKKEAIRGMTNWAAYSCFMEDRIGSLEVGKLADYVILNKDLMTEEHVVSIRILETVVAE